MLWRRPRRKSSSLTGGESMLTFYFSCFGSSFCRTDRERSVCYTEVFPASSEEPPVKDQLMRHLTAKSCDSSGGGCLMKRGTFRKCLFTSK